MKVSTGSRTARGAEVRLAIAIALLAAAFFASGAGSTDASGVASHPRYRVVHGWPILPEGEALGAVTGIGVDPRGDVYVFHRAGRGWPESDVLPLSPISQPTVDVFEGNSGKLLKRWGANLFAMPHGLTIDAQGNVWLTDVALQQVYKFTADGQPLLVLGERGIAGADARHFDRPTGVAVAGDGTFYVSDGYRNTRVMKFAPDGRFLFQWGTKGAGAGQFDVPHSIAIGADGIVYVADRGNRRVQTFDATGKFLVQWSSSALGRPYAIAVDENLAYVADGGDQPSVPPDRSAWAIARLDGMVLGRVGRFGNYDGQFEMAHSIAVDRAGAVYVGDILGARAQKFLPLR